jgi:hypothetical protein
MMICRVEPRHKEKAPTEASAFAASDLWSENVEQIKTDDDHKRHSK